MTEMRRVEPALWAVTTTPSMAPSSEEETLPVSAASAAQARGESRVACSRSTAAAAVVRLNKRLMRIANLPRDCLVDSGWAKSSWVAFRRVAFAWRVGFGALWHKVLAAVGWRIEEGSGEDGMRRIGMAAAI